MMKVCFTLFLVLLGLEASSGFQSQRPRKANADARSVASLLAASPTTVSTSSTAQQQQAEEIAIQKKKLLGLLRTDPQQDPVLADPITKEPVSIVTKSALLAGASRGSVTKFELASPSNTFAGTSDSFLNLLEPVSDNGSKSDTAENTNELVRNLVPFIPPPLRSALATAGLPVGDQYVPMRDLFTSPAVSFAYERGWRQGFASAGFPGPDQEADMAMDYFRASTSMASPSTVVDMSCATGLFTRRFAATGNYQRVLGCDYSASMLQEARRRIQIDRELPNANTRIDLVRLDVGQIPMQTESVDALHAGAAMHCWPDLPAAASEIYRVLKPGGRYFATTFLSSYFGNLQQAEGGATGPSRQAFQYFGSVDELRNLMQQGGFRRENILVEVLGSACVVIRCEK